MSEVLLYSEKITPRLKYILKVFSNDYLKTNIQITSNPVQFENFRGVKINYSRQAFTKVAFVISPSGLLHEIGIKDKQIDIINHDVYINCFFQSNGNWPFDVLSAAFWLISRYEEYLPFKEDHVGRYEVGNSLAFQKKFLKIPLVNHWFALLKKELEGIFSVQFSQERNFALVSTVDIDNVYKYKRKGLMRSMASLARNLKHFQFDEMVKQLKVQIYGAKDPFDCYDFFTEIKEQFPHSLIVFYLLGDYGLNDKNHAANNPVYQELIKRLADYSDTGIHPSYRSNFKEGQLRRETLRLSNITHKEITKSRQHFSLLRFPETYENLLLAEITDDYSLGYANHNGFRASYCYPFKWYNIDKEEETRLTIHPYIINDVALIKVLNSSKEQVLIELNELIDTVKRHNGELITVFHNEILANESYELNWREVYVHLLKQAKA